MRPVCGLPVNPHRGDIVGGHGNERLKARIVIFDHLGAGELVEDHLLFDGNGSSFSGQGPDVWRTRRDPDVVFGLEQRLVTWL